MNDVISRMASNFLTTVLGILGGAISYLVQVGAKTPSTNAEWGQLALSALIAGLGAVAKDATTGSRPGESAPPSAPTVVVTKSEPSGEK